ncbi:unnamed protein product [Colias eurytheme]|nr:unnamed protein product [Colias eurytheme]
MTLYSSAFTRVVGALMTIALCASLQVSSVEGREESRKFTIEDLLTNNYENKASNDLGMDPCKAGQNGLSHDPSDHSV